jgi:ketosteroid isomerase-like protein
MLKTITVLLAVLTTSGATFGARATKDEAQIWSQEKAYWEYVKANDLDKYRQLWHRDFVGWPSVSPEPVHKDRITDWITANTSKDLTLHSYEIEQRAITVTGDVAIDHYRVKTTWAKADDADAQTSTSRITHTWIRTKDGNWQIIGGMSAPVNAEGK